MQQQYSLHDLCVHLRQVVALNFSEPVWITAEIAAANLSRGHLYLSLVQKNDQYDPSEPDEAMLAQAPAVVWMRDRRHLTKEYGTIIAQVFSEGAQVRLCVRVEYHERYGLRLQVVDVDPAYAMGLLALQRQQTLDTLRQEGLLTQNKTTQLPVVVQQVALITSPDAAGYHDFKAHLASNEFGYAFALHCFFTAVQGKNAAPEIVAALESIAQDPQQFDAVVIIRGGGARLDLAAFDDLALGRAVACTPLPVLSGIGHETDETVLDLVAYQAFKTPTAVADFLIGRSLQFENDFYQNAQRVAHYADGYCRQAEDQLAMGQFMLQQSARQRLSEAGYQLSETAQLLPYATTQLLRHKAQALDQAASLVASLAPEAVLKRGYALVTRQGKVQASAASIHQGDTLDIRFSDGSVSAQVLD